MNSLLKLIKYKSSEENTISINKDLLKWQFAVENSNIGVWSYDADKNMVFFSNESLKIIGYNEEEFELKPNDWNDKVHPDDKKKYFQDFQDHLNGLKPIYENTHRVLARDGSYKWVLDKGKIVEWTSEGKVKKIIGTHSDITKQKENQIELANSLSLITNQNKKLKSFALIVSHNLKSHAANFESLLGFYNEAENENEKKELIENLNTVSESLTNTISNLTEIVSSQSTNNIHIQNIHVNTFVNNTITLVNTNLSVSKGKLNNSIPDNLYINFNPAYFESIIQNLFSNAIKYKHPDRIAQIDLSAVETEESVIFKFTDNGLGIDLNKYGGNVFGLYKTFHKNKDSQGIGLHLTKNQIEAFGGKITIESEINIGTTFTVIIPNKKNPV